MQGISNKVTNIGEIQDVGQCLVKQVLFSVYNLMNNIKLM